VSLGTLYHCVGARSFRVLWGAAAGNIPIELVMLPFPPRVKQRDYLAINPLGTIPAFVADGTVMTESMAICEYLAARHPTSRLAVGNDEPDFAACLNWAHHGEATLSFPQAIILRYSRFEPEERRLPQAAEDYTRWFLARLRALEAVVSDGRRFLCADRLTLADLSVGYALLLADYLDLKNRFTPGVAAYYQGISSLPSFVRALEWEKEVAIVQGISPIPAPLLVG
jgi:glutathione S-transferase